MTSYLLLRKLAAIDEIRWLRLMYMHPASMTEALLDVFADLPEKFPYLDMPFQHIDSTMLSQMKRKTDEAGLRKLLETLRRRTQSSPFAPPSSWARRAKRKNNLRHFSIS